ncbi:MAG: M3 family metallopeptidase [Bacteroidaceae bacterium]|nr:M3 family metallopeptidase [Bacteroidaceae bacterium]
MNNPFSEKYNTLHETIPFGKIKMQHFEPAVLEGIKKEKEEEDNIANNPEQPTFENTILAIDRKGEMLSRVLAVMYNLMSAETCDELDELAQKMTPIISQHNSDFILNERIFKRVKAVYDAKPDLSEEDAMLLEKTYEAFEQNGANLEENDKARFRELREELSKTTLKFSQNHLKETNAYELHLTDAKDVDGLPESQLEQAAQCANEKGMTGWMFTLKAPSYAPFMQYAKNRELRKQMYMAYNTQCTHRNEYNNYETVAKIVNLRRELAQLLGHNTYAEHVLQRRMAEKPENVYNLFRQLEQNYHQPALKEVEAVEAMAKEMEGNDFQLMPWDFAYYSHKLQLKKYDLDAEMLRPYFPLEKVKKGIFQLANRLYGITFRENPDIEVYHKDVVAYEVFDADGTFLAVFYADFFPRKGKQSGAWMTNYAEQWVDDEGKDHRPIVSIVTNFTPPAAERPSLLTLGEVETFLHEFGHALHGIFSKTKRQTLSGTNVYWDFVELPSQFMENYAIEKDFLNTFAEHYETHEPLPDELVKKIIDSRNFNVAYACMRQLSFGVLDMAYYDRSESFSEDVRTFEHQAWSKVQILPQVDEACMSVQFGHIMSGGYAAGYYSYKWAEVLDADAFGLFKESGIFDRDTAQKFRTCILSKGATRHPMKLYEDFRGRKPTIDALLKRNGIKE